MEAESEYPQIAPWWPANVFPAIYPLTSNKQRSFSFPGFERANAGDVSGLVPESLVAYLPFPSLSRFNSNHTSQQLVFIRLGGSCLAVVLVGHALRQTGSIRLVCSSVQFSGRSGSSAMHGPATAKQKKTSHAF